MDLLIGQFHCLQLPRPFCLMYGGSLRYHQQNIYISCQVSDFCIKSFSRFCIKKEKKKMLFWLIEKDWPFFLILMNISNNIIHLRKLKHKAYFLGKNLNYFNTLCTGGFRPAPQYKSSENVLVYIPFQVSSALQCSASYLFVKMRSVKIVCFVLLALKTKKNRERRYWVHPL